MFRPERSTPPKRPCSMIHPQTPAQKPIVGRALKLHGQPQSQLQLRTCLPFRVQFSFVVFFAIKLQYRPDNRMTITSAWSTESFRLRVSLFSTVYSLVEIALQKVR